ncbi:MAG: hypothetical protein AAFV53_34380 [Myxococcota bacterium]
MQRAMIGSTLVSVCLFSSAAFAAPIAPDPFSGSGFDVNYCDLNGLWNEDANNTSSGVGLDWYSVPVSSPGDPWQQVSIESSTATYFGNGNECQSGVVGSSPWDTLTLDTYGSITPVTYSPQGGFVGENGSTTTWRAGNLRIHKHEYWGAVSDGDYEDGFDLSKESQALIIDVTISNMGCEDDEVYFMHGVDPDQDVASFTDYTTCNDTTPSENFVFSEGPNSGLTVGYGRCDEKAQSVGHTSTWDTDATGSTFSDEGYTRADYTQHINHFASVPALESVTFTFIFVAAQSKEAALERYYKTRAEVCCDEDSEDYETDRSYLKDLGECKESRTFEKYAVELKLGDVEAVVHKINAEALEKGSEAR